MRCLELPFRPVVSRLIDLLSTVSGRRDRQGRIGTNGGVGLVISAFVVCMCTTHAANAQNGDASLPSAEPATVVEALLEAMPANDAERIRSLFDADASQAYGDGTPKSGPEFFRWLESDIIERGGRVENARLETDGDEVVVTGLYRSRGYESEANFLLTVENGLITSWRMRY